MASQIDTTQPPTGGTLVSPPIRQNFAIASSEITALQSGTFAGTNVITYDKIQQETANTFLGNPTGSKANVQEIILGASLQFSGTTLQTVAMTNDVVSPANSLSGTISANAVTDAKFRQGTSLSIVGRSANSLGNVADIHSGTADAVLRTSHDGGTVQFGAVNLSSPNAVTGSLALSNGGLGTTSLVPHAILLGAGTNPLQFVTGGTFGALFIDQGAGTNPAFVPMVGDASIGTSGTIVVSRVNSVSYPSSAPTTNRVAVVNSAGAVSYGTVGNAALANSNIVISGTSVSLGGTASLMGTSTSLGANVLLNAGAANYTDGPSLNVGNAGVWLVLGNVTVADSSGATAFYGRLWDGTTVFDSTTVTQYTANLATAIPLSGIVSSPAGNVRISVRDTSGTNGTMFFNNTGNSKDCTLTAVRIG